MSLPASPAVRDERSATSVGRHARLELTFSLRKGRTVLSDAYAEPPYHVGGCFQEESGLHVIVASSAPGVFGGDCLQQTIRVERGAQVRLTSQSALQIHATADARTALLHSEYHIDDDARLHCVWHPSIPFADARLDQQIGIHVAESGQLGCAEAGARGESDVVLTTAGRPHCGAGGCVRRPLPLQSRPRRGARLGGRGGDERFGNDAGERTRHRIGYRGASPRGARDHRWPACCGRQTRPPAAARALDVARRSELSRGPRSSGRGAGVTRDEPIQSSTPATGHAPSSSRRARTEIPSHRPRASAAAAARAPAPSRGSLRCAPPW